VADHPPKLQVVSLHDPTGLVARVAVQPDLIRPRFAPIADIRRGGVASYEVMLAIGEDPPAAPAVWAAELHPRAAGAFEAQLLEVALAERERLPADATLCVNVSAAGIRSPAVRAVLEAAGRLERIVVMTTADDDEDGGVGTALEAVREAGGHIAVDETGSGYASLAHLLAVRPDYVRIGPAFVNGVDVDQAKAAVVEAIAAVASRIDAWVAASGIRSRQELSALRRMRIPLGQGPLFGAPKAVMGNLNARASDAIRSAAPPVEPAETVAALVEARPALPWASSLEEVADAFLEDPTHDVVVLVDERNRPLALADRAALLRGETFERPVMRITPTSPMRAVARRAAARPLIERFYPLVACDRRGVYLGLVRVEQLLDALAQD
jgi:EAL domain-containing protein (putative c-di-GMP-specific phosphodiesterase class I)